MIWNKYIIETTTEATDIVASILFDNGIVGVEIEDNTNLSDEDLKKMYVDIPVKKVDDGIAKVNFFVAILPKDEKGSYLEKYKRDDNINIDDSYRPSTDNIFTSDEFKEILNSVKAELEEYKSFMDMGALTISLEELDDNIFLNKWKENFKRIEFDDIVIAPSWEKGNVNQNVNYDKSSKLNIYIEPGKAFGTGQHATTKLCIRAIKNIIKKFNDNEKLIKIENADKNDLHLLDIGCGSGILGILAKKLGVKNICLIDVDEGVEFNLIENCKLNNYNALAKLTNIDNVVDTKNDSNHIKTIYYGFGNLIDNHDLRQKVGYGKYDIVVANILAPVICTLLGTGEVDKFIKPGGYFICSGILMEKEDEVRAAIEKNGHFIIEPIMTQDDWVAIIAKNA